MPVTGVKPGASGTFAATTIPVGATLPAGIVPKWTSDNPAVTLVDAADGLTTVATVPADATGSFGLTVTAQVNGADVTGTVSVPIVAADVTGFTIDQVA